MKIGDPGQHVSVYQSARNTPVKTTKRRARNQPQEDSDFRP